MLHFPARLPSAKIHPLDIVTGDTLHFPFVKTTVPLPFSYPLTSIVTGYGFAEKLKLTVQAISFFPTD